MTELMCAYSVLEYKHKALQDRKRPARKGKGQNGKKQKGNKTGDFKEMDPGAPCKFYCHAHGSQNSHSSNQCKVMAGQKQHFSEAMRNATSATSPGGGSTLVRGKDPSTITQATAYMMSAVTSEESDDEDSNSPRNHGGPRPATPLVQLEEDESADTTHDDITYNHQAAFHTAAVAHHEGDALNAATRGDVSQSSTNSATLPPRMSFFDNEYVQGRRVPSPPQTAMELNFEPPHAVDYVRNNIANLLAHSTWLPDFKEHRIPSIQRNPQVHHELVALMQQRAGVERDLMDMLEDRAADGTPLDPTRNFDKEYERLNQLYDDLNRAMFNCYLVYIDDKAFTREKKRKADIALGAMAEADTPPMVRLPGAEPAALMVAGSVPSTQPDTGLPPCPYQHASEQPPQTPTSPQMNTVEVQVPPTLARALLVHQFPPPGGPGVTAIADSGASHILIRHEDAHILHEVQYTRPEYST